MDHHPENPECDFDRKRQWLLSAWETMESRITTTAAAWTTCPSLYVFVPLLAILADAALGFAGFHDPIRSRLQGEAASALAAAFLSLMLSAGLVISLWLADLCLESSRGWRRSILTLIFLIPILISVTPIVGSRRLHK